MKKLVSLLMIVAMLCSFCIVANAATATGTLDFTLDADPMEAAPGDEIEVTFNIPKNSGLVSVGFYIFYDDGIFEVTDMASGNSECNEEAPGVIKCGYGKGSGASRATAVATIYFAVKEDAVATKDYFFDAAFDETIEPQYSPTCDTNVEYLSLDKCSIENNTGDMEIELPEPPAADFTVTAVENGNDVVVTVANKGDKAGFVYVANYVNGVLDNCEVKALADGELTFTGLAGDAKVFVWDANNAPILDAAIEL